MKLDIDTAVRYPDGGQVGTINKVVFDPHAGTVEEIVLESAELLGRRILVPVRLLREDPGEVLTLDATPDEVDELPSYEVERYIDAPEDWQPSENYAPGSGLFPATMFYPTAPIFEESNAGEGTVELSQGTEVRCGEDRLGIIDQVLIDEDDDRLIGLVIRPDDPATPRWLITPDLIEAADSQVVQLGCTLEELPDRATPYEDPGAEPEAESLIPSS